MKHVMTLTAAVMMLSGGINPVRAQCISDWKPGNGLHGVGDRGDEVDATAVCDDGSGPADDHSGQDDTLSVEAPRVSWRR